MSWSGDLLTKFDYSEPEQPEEEIETCECGNRSDRMEWHECQSCHGSIVDATKRMCGICVTKCAQCDQNCCPGCLVDFEGEKTCAECMKVIASEGAEILKETA